MLLLILYKLNLIKSKIYCLYHLAFLTYGTVITQLTDTSVAYPRLTASRWRYSGKEEQQGVTGINFIDYGARLYNPAIGSWLSHDPGGNY